MDSNMMTHGHDLRRAMRRSVLVNVGCGTIVHDAWLNLDVEPEIPAVTRLDVRKGIPLPDGVADACFSSHVIEHLSPEAAAGFLREQFRVLKGGGLIRVVAPDLEAIARFYVRTLDETEGSSAPTFEHRHAVAELIDQLVRDRPGGHLAALWKETPPEKRDWVVNRMGYVAAGQFSESIKDKDPVRTRFLRAISNPARRARLRRRMHEHAIRVLVRLVGGKRLAEAFREGCFRGQGDVHRWMYDRVTLGESLTKAGFVKPTFCRLGESRIPEWSSYGLEIRDDKPLKPHSLVVEAEKP